MKGFGAFVMILVSVALLISAGLVGYDGYQKYLRDKEIQAEIAKLEQEAQALNIDNRKLSERIEYFRTEEFKEKLAKDKLNYKKEGEELVIIKPNAVGFTVEEGQVLGAETQEQETLAPPYHKQWWKYFFSNEK